MLERTGYIFKRSERITWSVVMSCLSKQTNKKTTAMFLAVPAKKKTILGIYAKNWHQALDKGTENQI